MINRDTIINGIIGIAKKKHPESEVFLFGSQATGKANENSDWDILILLNQPEVSFNQETEIMDDYYDLELSSGVVISPIIYSKKEWNTKYSSIPLHLNINEEGIKLI